MNDSVEAINKAIEDDIHETEKGVDGQLARIGMVSLEDENSPMIKAEKLLRIKRIMSMYPDIAETLDIEAIKAKAKLVPELMKLSIDELEALLHSQSSVMQKEVHTSAVGATSFLMSRVTQGNISDSEPLLVGLADYMLRYAKTYVSDIFWQILAGIGVLTASRLGYNRNPEHILATYAQIEKNRSIRAEMSRENNSNAKRERDEKIKSSNKKIKRSSPEKETEEQVSEEEEFSDIGED